MSSGPPLEEKLASVLEEIRRQDGRVVVLTGAGMSAESGIPTFRGTDGYWVVGSRNYMPQEMATAEMFELAPTEVWHWYLYRFGICAEARPNPGHEALVRLERALGERFTLVTQNIDGLHRRAGSERVLCIHGDAAYVRCAAGCGVGLLEQPRFPPRRQDDRFSEADLARLRCRCGSWLRPHVLWFDEFYDEPNYRMDTALRAAEQADLLLVVGTSGATNLPWQIGRLAFHRGAAIVDVNPEENPFADLATRLPRGFHARGSACERLPAIVAALGA